jgi:Ulp1 family protease
MLFVRDGQLCFAVGESTFVLQEGRSRYTQVFKPISSEFQNLSLIFVPYNVERHFCLYVMDMKNKLITHLDPMKGNDLRNKKKCEKITEFLRIIRMSTKETINVDEMEFKKIDYPLQNDGSICGVYTIFFLAELSKRDKINDIK